MGALYNGDAERNLLGDVLTCPADFHKISGIVTAGDFYHEENRLLYELMAGMILQGRKLDVVTLAEAAKERLAGETANFMQVYSSIMSIGGVGRCYTLEETAGIVADYARRRQLIEKARELAAAAADIGQEVESIAAGVLDDIQAIGSSTGDEVADMAAAVLSLEALIERRKNGNMLYSGLRALDGIVCGFEPGELIVIAGRPGHGKSALAGTIAFNIALLEKHVLFFSMEMSEAELAGRFLSRQANIPGRLLKKPGSMDKGQEEAYKIAAASLSKIPMDICTKASLTPGDVVTISTRQKRTKGLDLVIVDYLQLMTSGKKSDSNRVQEISTITRALKTLAGSLKIPVILLSQLNRANAKEKVEPRLIDLRDSGSIEQDANTVLLLHRDTDPFGGLETKTLLNVAKQRNDSQGKCYLEFRAEKCYFDDYDPSLDIPL